MRGHRLVSAVAVLLAAACLLAPARGAAQTTTGTVRGYVRTAEGAEVAGATVTARNAETNTQRQVATSANGFYLLPGLRPGTYELSVRMLGQGEQRRTLRLMVGQTVDANFTLATQAVTLEAITVAAAPSAVETRTSEVATNVTQQQVENLPTADRNFLSLAVLAPGTQLQGDRLDATRKTFSAGAQGADQVNVFIDGASYKNDILQGGVAGQDASRGNPFPRNAIREFRVITQNFKAEYQKASSAIITATTRSGSNEWESSGFLNYQHEGLIALDSFQRFSRAANPRTFSRPDFKRYQFGANAGGPIIRDRLFFFGSFERNDQNRGRRVNINPPTGFPALDSINFAQYNGEFDEPFRSTLLFGKLTWERNPASFVELSYHHRHENDIRDFGGLTSFQTATRFHNDVNTAILKHNWTRGALLNEATASFQRYQYNPVANSPGMVNRFFGFGCCAEIGSNRSEQKFGQDRLSLRNDLTWSGLRSGGEHVIKGGFNLDFLKYDIEKRNSENPRFIYEPWFNNFEIPHRVEFQTGDPNFGARNTQLGLYVQDDWSPTERLVLNLGIRWDYESHMMNYDHETPAAVQDSLVKYADRLFIPLGDRYFTDGGDRKPFLGAFQPRLGFSWALDENSTTSVFGGWGIFYDRMVFDLAIEESFALQHPSYTLYFAPRGATGGGNVVPFEDRFLSDPGAIIEVIGDNRFNTPEVKLLPNDLRPPKAQHFNLGIRSAIGPFEASAAYTAVRSKGVITFYWANENFTCPARSFSVDGCFTHNTIPGWGNILVADDQGKTWYDAVQLKLDRPYRRLAAGRMGWGAGAAVTIGERETQGFNDQFSFPNPVDYPRQVRNDERFRLVGNWIVDVPYLWGAQFSGLVTLGTGSRYDVGGRFDCHQASTCFEAGGFEQDRHSFLFPNIVSYRMVDLRLRKEFVNVRGATLGVSAELFNAFNYNNYGGYNTFDRLNRQFGDATGIGSDPRRLQIGLEYNKR